MSKSLIAVLAMAGLGLLFAVIIGIWWVTTSNREIGLRNRIEAKQRDNHNVYDATWKQITQSAQVTEAQARALMDIATGYAQARSGNGGGSLATSVTEVVPTMDTSNFNQLLNIITAARAQFARAQTEILDLGREHTNCLTLFPSSLVCGGRPPITIDLVTSTRTTQAFATGIDDDVRVFAPPAPSAVER
jgi:hypothetical protein